MCPGKKCLAPEPCKALQVDHTEYLEILRKLRKLPKVKRVFIRSGIRFDYVMADKDDTFFKELVSEHVSGQLKVAPEHVSNNVLDKMGKPHIECYEAFQKRFYEITKSIGKKQYLVPYLMSSHPGSTLQDAVKLSLFLRDHGMHPEQVQDFYPTPGTISTCMYYTELDPYTMEPVYVPLRLQCQGLFLQLLRRSNRRGYTHATNCCSCLWCTPTLHALFSITSLTKRALFLHRICRLRTYASSHLRLHNGVAKLWNDDRSDGTKVAKAGHEMLYKRSV